MSLEFFVLFFNYMANSACNYFNSLSSRTSAESAKNVISHRWEIFQFSNRTTRFATHNFIYRRIDFLLLEFHYFVAYYIWYHLLTCCDRTIEHNEWVMSQKKKLLINWPCLEIKFAFPIETT